MIAELLILGIKKSRLKNYTKHGFADATFANSLPYGFHSSHKATKGTE
ncbi:hypothetical protein L6259_01895 [Candidatus Parcubacteria bacterium]|nr:hypothetical protein [Candidatus Parcubacteria bacterium]